MKNKAESFPAIRRQAGVALSLIALLSLTVSVLPQESAAEATWRPAKRIAGPQNAPTQKEDPNILKPGANQWPPATQTEPELPPKQMNGAWPAESAKPMDGQWPADKPMDGQWPSEQSKPMDGNWPAEDAAKPMDGSWPANKPMDGQWPADDQAKQMDGSWGEPPDAPLDHAQDDSWPPGKPMNGSWPGDGNAKPMDSQWPADKPMDGNWPAQPEAHVEPTPATEPVIGDVSPMWGKPGIRAQARHILGVSELPGYTPLLFDTSHDEKTRMLLLQHSNGKDTFQLVEYKESVWSEKARTAPWMLFNHGTISPGTLQVESIRVRRKKHPVVSYQSNDPNFAPYQHVAMLHYPKGRLVVVYGSSNNNGDGVLSAMENLIETTRLKQNVNPPNRWPVAADFDPDAALHATTPEARPVTESQPEAIPDTRIEVEPETADAVKRSEKKAEPKQAARTETRREKPRRHEKYPAVTNPVNGKPGPALPEPVQPEAVQAGPESWDPTASPTLVEKNGTAYTGQPDHPIAQPLTVQPVSEPVSYGSGDLASLSPEVFPEPEVEETPGATEEAQPSSSKISGKVEKKTAAEAEKPAKAEKAPQKAEVNKPRRKKEKPVVHFPEQPAPATSVAASEPSARKLNMPSPLSERQQFMLDQALLHYRRANAYGHRDRYDEAIAEYQKALQLYPAFADAHVGLSSAYAKQNEWEQVIEEVLTVLDKPKTTTFIDPANRVRAWYNLSTAFCVADDYGKARKYYKKVKLSGHPNTDRLWSYIQHNCKPDGLF